MSSFFQNNLLRRTGRGSVDSDCSTSPPVSVVVENNVRRRRIEDRLALLFMGIVLMFFACSLPRLLLNLYEFFYIEQCLACSKLKRP